MRNLSGFYVAIQCLAKELGNTPGLMDQFSVLCWNTSYWTKQRRQVGHVVLPEFFF